MVARRARLEAARAGEVRGQHAAYGPPARLTAMQRAIIHRLESELLAVFGKQLFDLGKRRAGAGRQDKFGWLVEGDAGQVRQVERVLGLQRAADAALGAMAEDFEGDSCANAHWTAESVSADVVGVKVVTGAHHWLLGF